MKKFKLTHMVYGSTIYKVIDIKLYNHLYLDKDKPIVVLTYKCINPHSTKEHTKYLNIPMNNKYYAASI